MFKKGDLVYWSGNNPTFGVVVNNRSDYYSLDVKGDIRSYDSCFKGYLRLATDEERDEYWSGLTKGTEVLLRRDSGDEMVLVIDYEQDNIYFFTNGDAYYKYKIRKIMNKNKKIVGYRLKTECFIYEQAALKITEQGVNSWGENLTKLGYMFTSISVNCELLRNAKVLDLWFEPVYEDEPIIIGGTYKVDFVGGSFFKINGTSYQKTDLILVKNVLELTAVQSINVGCSGQYQIDLTTVNKILSRL